MHETLSFFYLKNDLVLWTPTLKFVEISSPTPPFVSQIYQFFLTLILAGFTSGLLLYDPAPSFSGIFCFPQNYREFCMKVPPPPHVSLIYEFLSRAEH